MNNLEGTVKLLEMRFILRSPLQKKNTSIAPTKQGQRKESIRKPQNLSLN